MPRPGAGGTSSGGSRSASGNSSSRSVSGHHVGQSTSRPGAGTGMGASRGPHNPPPHSRGYNSPPPRRRGYYPPPPPPHGGYYPPPRRRAPVRSTSSGGSGSVGGVLIGIVIFIVFIMLCVMVGNSCDNGGTTTYYDNTPQSTKVREKLNSGHSYNSKCIIDELGYFDDVAEAGDSLKAFWSKTGVQPYVVMHKYESGLNSDAQKDRWAVDYYDANFDSEDIFLFVYFEDSNPNEIGYMTAVCGQQVDSIMDGEAKKIFWANIDKYWTSDLSTDKVFEKAYKDTANSIMRATKTRDEVRSKSLTIGIVILVIILVALIAAFVIRMIKMKQRRAKEKAEEDERILNTPLSEMAETEADKLANKYLSDEEK